MKGKEYNKLIKDRFSYKIRDKRILKNGEHAICKIVEIDGEGLTALFEKVPFGIRYTKREALEFLECYG